jgi:hypothetical protein
MPVPRATAEYGCSNWKWWLNNTTVTLGMQNVLDADPPFVAGSFENGYDESIATIKGRFWYVGLKKRFQFSPLVRLTRGSPDVCRDCLFIVLLFVS